MANWQEMFLADLQNQKSSQPKKPIGFVENIQQGGFSGFADRATFGIKPMVEAGILYNATKRFQLDDYPRTDDGWNQRQKDKQGIVDYLTEQAQRNERGLTIPAKVGTVVFDMLPFMAEFIATGGLASLGKAGAKKSILKLTQKYLSKKTANIAADIGSTAVSAGIRTSLTPQHIAEGYFQNQMSDMALDENSNINFTGEIKDPIKSLYKAIGNQFIEFLSEESGAGISKAVSSMAQGVLPKGVNSQISKMVNGLRKTWIKAAPGRDSLEFAKRISEKAGFHGILEEIGEERLGDTLRAVFNVDDFGTNGGNIIDRLVASIPNGEQLLVEALAFSVPAAGKAALAVGHEIKNKDKDKNQSGPKYSIVAVEGDENKIISKWGKNSEQVKALEEVKKYYESDVFEKTPYFRGGANNLRVKLNIGADASLNLAREAFNQTYIRVLGNLAEDNSLEYINEAKQTSKDENISLADAFVLRGKLGFYSAISNIVNKEAAQGTIKIEQSDGETSHPGTISQESSSTGVAKDFREYKGRFTAADAFERVKGVGVGYAGNKRLAGDVNMRMVAEMADEVLADPGKSPLNKSQMKEYLQIRQAAVNMRMRPFAAYWKAGKNREAAQKAWQRARELLLEESQSIYKDRLKTGELVKEERVGRLAKENIPGFLTQNTGPDSAWKWTYPDASKTVTVIDPDAEFIPGKILKGVSRKGVMVYRWQIVTKDPQIYHSQYLNNAQEAISEKEAVRRRDAAWEALKKNDKNLYKKTLEIKRKVGLGTSNEKIAIEWVKKMYDKLRTENPELHNKFEQTLEGSQRHAPKLTVWPDWLEASKWLDSDLTKPVELTVIGKELVETTPEFDAAFKRLTKSKWIGQIAEIELTKENPLATEQESVISKGQRWTHEQKQNKRQFRIAGKTSFDRSSGRIRITAYSAGHGSPRTIAEEVHHVVFEIIRQGMRKTFGAIQTWHETNIKNGGDPTLDISEAFAQAMADEEIGYNSGLPNDIVKVANDIVRKGGTLSTSLAKKVIAAFENNQYSIEAEKPAPFTTEPAETEKGKTLLRRLDINSQKRGLKKAGLRSIVEFANDIVHTKMLVGKTQTTKRHPAHFEVMPHLIRTQSGVWQLNFHEAGHGLSHLLAEADHAWKADMNAGLVSLTKRSDSYASAKTPEEGMAELVRRFIADYNSIPPALLEKFTDALKKHEPDILAGLKDANRAYTHWRSLPIEYRLETIGSDQPPQKSKLELLKELAVRTLYNIVGGSTIIDKMIRDAYLGIAGMGRSSYADITGVVSIIRTKFDRAFDSRLKLARAFLSEIRDTPADVESAYQSTIHILQEAQRALYGVHSGQEGIRVLSTNGGFSKFDDADIKTLKDAGFEIPKHNTSHGNWIYLSDKSISKIRHQIGLDKWNAFSLYGQYRAAIHRYKTKKHDYPGRLDGLTPDVLQGWLKEQETTNPQWDSHFKEINKYMDQLLLVSVLGGELAVPEAVKIKTAWTDYWPLPRQVEDRPTAKSGLGVEPSSGIYSAHGSPLPFMGLDDALEFRTKSALQAYYTNRFMLALRNFNQKLGNYSAAPFDIRKEALQIMLPLHLESKKAAELTKDEESRIIADYLNNQLAEKMGVTVEELKINGQIINPDDIEISTPSRPIWRMGKPNAVHIIAPFEDGKRKYYQLTDPLLFDLLSKGKQPSKYFMFLSHSLTKMIEPWRRALTQNIGFALANTLSRDPSNAGFMGQDGAKALIPYFYAGCGLINRLKGRDVNSDAMSQSELLSKALDHTAKDAHQGIVGSFKEMLKEGILIQNWQDMTVSAQIAEAPGQAMSIITKPIDIFNWISGGRFFSQLGEELPREGAFISAQKRGQSPERAQMSYDYITGNFGQKGGSPAIAAAVRSAGFLNPGIQIMGGQLSRMLDPDPKVRAFNIGAKIPALMTWGAIGAAINYLIICAVNPDDDDRKEVLDQMKERPDENRLGYMAIAGKLRLPFDYGIIGASVSYGWNSVEQWLLDDHISAEQKAKVLLARARDLPGITDIINPYIKTGAELWLNHSFFYDDEIVPAWMEAAYPYNPDMQTWPNMPKVYEMIGKGLRVSPIKVKYAVSQLFTRQMDDAVKLVEKLSGKNPYSEGADLPVVGRVIDRKSIGFQSKSVKSVAELDVQWQTLNNQIRHLIASNADKAQIRELKTEQAKLNRAHKTMLYISKIYNHVKAESAKPNSDKAKIDRLKNQMTKKAKIFLERYQKVA